MTDLSIFNGRHMRLPAQSYLLRALCGVFLGVVLIGGCSETEEQGQEGVATETAGVEGDPVPLSQSGDMEDEGAVEEEGTYPEFDRMARVQRLAAMSFDPAVGATAFETCAACHGPEGLGSRDGTIPRLAGQHREVVLQRLIEISDGVRIREEMEAYKPAIKTDEQIGALAQFVSGMKDPLEVYHGTGDALDSAGVQYQSLCMPCHFSNGQGDGPSGIPRIGGWDAPAVVHVLQKLRIDDAEIHETGMSDLASMLTDSEIDSLADYVSRLSGQPASANADE